MRFSLATLWFERQRFFPALLAVAFAGMLVALQFGLLMGTFSLVSIPIDHTQADFWVGAVGVQSVDVSRSIPRYWESRLFLPGVERVEPYYQEFCRWEKTRGGSELVIVVGC